MPASEVVGQASLQDSVAIPEMLFISGGDFVMGSDPATDSDAKENEQPPHAVKIKDFHIGKYEVTFEEYDAFVKSTGRRTPGDKKWGRGQRPVINVSSEAATAYAEWLSLMTGKKPTDCLQRRNGSTQHGQEARRATGGVMLLIRMARCGRTTKDTVIEILTEGQHR